MNIKLPMLLQECRQFELPKVVTVFIFLTLLCVLQLSTHLSRLRKVTLSRVDNARVGRYAANGRWYSQTVPFPLHVFSAFYDNRTSLLSNGPQVVIVSQFHDQRIDRCVLWFSYDGESVQVPGKVTPMNLADKVVICSLPMNITRGRMPFDVTLAWTNHTAVTGVSKTSFRVPVEVPCWRTSRGRLALCLSAAFDTRHWRPRQIVEWLEMQRLLGVERIIVYNQSMSSDASRVFSEYTRRRAFNDDETDSSDDPFVEVRQTRGPLPGVDSTYAHQTTTMNDCMYRNIGSFRHIAFMDFDEVIIPRKNFTKLPELIDHLTSSYNGTIGSFVFRNAHFFVQPLANETESLDEDIKQLIPVSYRNTSFSTYLTQRRRAKVSPPWFVVKSVIDSDSCVGMWVHICCLFTERYRDNAQHNVVEKFEVDYDLALKHHYRRSCNLDGFGGFYTAGSCDREMKSPVVDAVIKKYGDELVRKLSKRYEISKL